MITTTLSGKGQIVIPKSLRESRRWRPGTQFIVEEITSGILLKHNRTFPLTRLEDGLGCTGYHGPAINVQDMDQAIQGDIRSAGGKEKARSLTQSPRKGFVKRRPAMPFVSFSLTRRRKRKGKTP